MRLPQFTAEASLARTSLGYSGLSTWSSRPATDSVIGQIFFHHGCPPGCFRHCFEGHCGCICF